MKSYLKTGAVMLAALVIYNKFIMPRLG